jgi:tetratricopeptide (TPR) repeat protein
MGWPGHRLIFTKSSKFWAAMLLAWFAFGAHAQEQPVGGGQIPSGYAPMVSSLQQVTITIGVRDARGLPIEEPATVHLTSNLRRVNRDSDTRDSADVNFANLLEGPYEVEVDCPGYRPVREHLDVTGGAAFFRSYIYLHSANDPNTANAPPAGQGLSPKAVAEVDKGLAALRKKQYESADVHFTKASNYAPKNPDIYYLRGNSELRGGKPEFARKDFEAALNLDATHEKALVALGQMQLQSGDTAGAIATLSRTAAANGAGWRTNYLLGLAYANSKQWKEAEAAARRAVSLAGPQAAGPMVLWGKIRFEVGDTSAARDAWQKVVADYPGTPQATEAKEKLAAITAGNGAGNAAALGAAKIDVAKDDLAEETNRPWAPPDIDSKEYYVTPGASCDVNEVLTRGIARVKIEMVNLEKFTAVEHIEHQEIDRHGQAGPIKTRQFSYIVFVHSYKGDSSFLEESRDGGPTMPAFPTSLATVGLNSLGVSVLQPAYRDGFSYHCEGVGTVRGQAAWQVRFEEKKDARLGVRRWQREGTIYNIPIKGRIWLSTATFDIMRVETDLREPMSDLELSRDHVQVEYGPVTFKSMDEPMWLPWSAEMYLELHGKRYHHKHYLTDYLLFGVDSSAKVNGPKEAPKEEEVLKPADKP